MSATATPVEDQLEQDVIPKEEIETNVNLIKAYIDKCGTSNLRIISFLTMVLSMVLSILACSLTASQFDLILSEAYKELERYEQR